MAHLNFRFWTCPKCIHVQSLNLEQMTNRCHLIDDGESPVDGNAWEHQDHDICPVFESRENQQVTILAADSPSVPNISSV
jgi:hypothetical protein